jgi:hypothetical protein
VKPSEPRFVWSDHCCPAKVKNEHKSNQYKLGQPIFYEKQCSNKHPSHKAELPKIKILQISLIMVLIKKDFSEEVVHHSFLLPHFIVTQSPP